MNWLSEILSFNDWLMYNPLPTSAIALWHGIMAVNNKCGWADEFTIANKTLEFLTGLGRDGVEQGRNRLIQKGRIAYKKGSGNQAGTYRVIYFDCRNYGTNNGTNAAQSTAQVPHNTPLLNKHKHKHKSSSDEEETPSPQNEVSIDDNSETDPLENKKKEKRKKVAPKKEKAQPHLFRESPLFDKTTFVQAFEAAGYEELDPEHYYDALLKWSDYGSRKNPGEQVSHNWLMNMHSFIRRDKIDNTLFFKQKNGKTSEFSQRVELMNRVSNSFQYDANGMMIN